MTRSRRKRHHRVFEGVSRDLVADSPMQAAYDAEFARAAREAERKLALDQALERLAKARTQRAPQ